jgi:hypothetical protein
VGYCVQKLTVTRQPVCRLELFLSMNVRDVINLHFSCRNPKNSEINYHRKQNYMRTFQFAFDFVKKGQSCRHPHSLQWRGNEINDQRTDSCSLWEETFLFLFLHNAQEQPWCPPVVPYWALKSFPCCCVQDVNLTAPNFLLLRVRMTGCVPTCLHTSFWQDT